MLYRPNNDALCRPVIGYLQLSADFRPQDTQVSVSRIDCTEKTRVCRLYTVTNDVSLHVETRQCACTGEIIIYRVQSTRTCAWPCEIFAYRNIALQASSECNIFKRRLHGGEYTNPITFNYLRCCLPFFINVAFNASIQTKQALVSYGSRTAWVVSIVPSGRTSWIQPWVVGQLWRARTASVHGE